MAFQGRHRTRSGLHKINSVLLEGKGEKGGSLVWRGLIYKRSCPARSTSRSHGSAGSGSLLSTRAGAVDWGQSGFAEGVLALPQLCPLGCQAGRRVSPHRRQGRERPMLPGGVPSPWGTVGLLKEPGCKIRLSWWPSLSVGQRRGASLSCLSSCAGGVCGESHHHCASRHLAGGRREGEAEQCQAFRSWGIKPIVY